MIAPWHLVVAWWGARRVSCCSVRRTSRPRRREAWRLEWAGRFHLVTVKGVE